MSCVYGVYVWLLVGFGDLLFSRGLSFAFVLMVCGIGLKHFNSIYYVCSFCILLLVETCCDCWFISLLVFSWGVGCVLFGCCLLCWVLLLVLLVLVLCLV